MEDVPPGPGGPRGPFWGRGGPFPFRGPGSAKAERVEFTDEQKREVASALHEAQVAVLKAIARSASLDDTGYAARTTVRLTHALATLRAAAGQTQGGFPFFPGPPVPWDAGPWDMEGPEEFGEP